MNLDDLWKTILNDLEFSISKSNFMTWIRPTRISDLQKIDIGKQIVELACPSAYHRQYIEERYLDQIKEALDRITKQDNSIKLVIGDSFLNIGEEDDKQGPLFDLGSQASTDEQLFRDAVLKARLREDFTFKNFAVSSSNEMAHAAAQAIAKTPGEAYNPLFLYGGVGVGKTHLIHAIGHSVLKRKSEARVIYCTGEDFTNEIIDAIRRKQTHPFKRKYRSAELLLIDDIQFIAGKTAVQEEFFHTFNAIQGEGGQIILVSDQPPHDIDGLEARLRSRFEAGLTIDIQQPNFELRTAILLIKAKRLRISLPMNIAQLIAANIESARRLEGFITRLASESRLRNQEISEPLVRGLLGVLQETETNSKPAIPPKQLVNSIAYHFNIKPSLICGPRRLKTFVFPRHLAMYLLRNDLKIPYEEIGEIFGGRDHTTVMHAVDKITNSLSNDEDLRVELSTIRKKLYH